MEFAQIQELIKLLNRSKITDFELKQGDFKLVIRSQKEGGEYVAPAALPPLATAVVQPSVVAPLVVPSAAPVATAPAPAAPATAEPAPAPANTKQTVIKSPMVGTFYRSGAPGKPAFVKIGDTVAKGTTVCIIEAMKLFNEIESDIAGTVVKILVEDAQPVEFDQPLFVVETA